MAAQALPGFTIDTPSVQALPGFTVDVPRGTSDPLTANPSGEGTYKMVGPQGQQVSVPFSKVRGAQDSKFMVVPSDASRYQKDAGQQPGFLRSAYEATPLPTAINAISHPIDTASNIADALLIPTANGGPSPNNPIVKGTNSAVKSLTDAGSAYVQAAKNDEPMKATAILSNAVLGGLPGKAASQVGEGNYGGALGTVVGGTTALAAPSLGDAVGAGFDAAGNAIKPLAKAIGQTSEDAGIGLMNKTVGTLKNDFKRGANPARGYFNTDNGPSISMSSIAQKAADSLDATGQALGQAYQQSTAKGVLIPVDTVAQELAKPIQKAIDLESGPGGTGNIDPIKNYAEQFGPAFEKATANGGFTPSDLFDIKRSIAQNTNWSDPTQFSLKSVRQQQAGALAGLLSDAVPETADLNQDYQDLTKLSARAAERANTGSRPLTAHIYKAGGALAGAAAGAMDGHAMLGASIGTALDSVPVKTTLATALVKGGRALQSLAAPAESSAVESVPAQNLIGDGANNESGQPHTPQPTTGPEAWANAGAEKVATHISSDPSSGLTKADIATAAAIPKGRQLLINASDLSPGTPAMKNLVAQLKTAIGASQ